MPRQMKLDPEQLESDRIQKKRDPTHRFECLLDGNVWRFDLNIDFKGKPNSLCLLAMRHANTHGKVCEHKMVGVNVLLWYRAATLEDVTPKSKVLRRWFEENGKDLSNPIDDVSDEELAEHDLGDD